MNVPERPLCRRLPTTLAAALAALTLLLAAASVALDILTHKNVLSNSGQILAASVSFAVLGFLVARQQLRNPIGWLMLAAAATLMLTSAAATYAQLAYRPGHRLPLGPAALLLGYSWILPLAALSLAILLFPEGRLPSPHWRWMLRAAMAAVTCFLATTYATVLRAVIGHPVQWDASGGLAAVEHPSGWLASVGNLFLLLIAACLLSFLAAQVLNWRRSFGLRRQQLKWLLTGSAAFLFGGIVALLVTAIGWTPPTLIGAGVTILSVFGLAALPAGIAMAILKYRLYDIDRIISRTLSYAIVTGLLLGVYAGLVLLATRVLPISSPVAVAASTLAIAALFTPVRRRVQRVVDRRFNRARYDADQTVAAFAARLKEAVDLDSARDDLAGVVYQALEPAHISVWISQHD